MPLFDSLKKATQDVVRGTKDMTDTARLNSLIAEEERALMDLYTQLGKLYFETVPNNDETPLGRLCFAIKSANERIYKYQEDIREIKGIRRCPSCSADVPVTSAFCGACGFKMDIAEERPSEEDAKHVCEECGVEIDASLAFCTNCGKKQEE